MCVFDVCCGLCSDPFGCWLNVSAAAGCGGAPWHCVRVECVVCVECVDRTSVGLQCRSESHSTKIRSQKLLKDSDN